MKYTIATLGCKVNQYETAAIEAMLRERGFSLCKNDADAAIVNTCAVTAESVRKSRQAIRRLKSENPKAIVAVLGCSSQLSPGEMEELGADIVFGSGDRVKFVAEIEKMLRSRGERVVDVTEAKLRREFEQLPSGSVSGRTRAMLKIEDGCDNFCSYCVIPLARGRVRSLPVESAAEEANKLWNQGFRELVITGIEIASYGKDLGNAGLIDCVEAISAAAPEMRLRLGSLEPNIVTRDFAERLAKRKNVCRHFHLSLQSGCDETLTAMHRKYNTGRFFEATQYLRDAFPNCGLTADLIVGFPGETRENHEKTLEFIEKCAFSSMHIFPYSLRPGTRAERMTGHLTAAEKSKRAAQAQTLAAKMTENFLKSCVGRSLSVLFESEDAGTCTGHADNYAGVCVRETQLRGLVKNVLITGVSGEMLVGKVV